MATENIKIIITASTPELALEKKNNLLYAIAENYNYQAKLEDGTPNPEGKKEYAKRMILNFCKDNYRAWKAQQAETTRQTLIADANTYTTDVTME